MPHACARTDITPTFLFIGADKCGSTWLYRVLAQHPECYVPKAKDIYFFDRYYHKGWTWYLRFFNDAPATAKAIGELSHDYLYSSVAAERIAQCLPAIRLLVFLRNPVERSFSEYLFLVRSGLTTEGFDEAVDTHPEIVQHSLYARHLQPYLTLYKQHEQLGIFLYEDLASDPSSFAVRILNFLGVDPLNVPVARERILPAARPRSRILALMMTRGAQATRALGRPGIVGMVKSSRLRELLYRTYAAGERPMMRAATRDRLQHFFESDIAALEALTGLNCDRWRANPPTSPIGHGLA